MPNFEPDFGPVRKGSGPNRGSEPDCGITRPPWIRGHWHVLKLGSAKIFEPSSNDSLQSVTRSTVSVCLVNNGNVRLTFRLVPLSFRVSVHIEFLAISQKMDKLVIVKKTHTEGFPNKVNPMLWTLETVSGWMQDLDEGPCTASFTYLIFSTVIPESDGRRSGLRATDIFIGGEMAISTRG